MKKMNLSFSGLKAKMVLPLFLLIGLFMFSASSVNAQYVSADTAKELIESHLDKIPVQNTVMAQVLRVNEQLKGAKLVEYKNMLRTGFGRVIQRNLVNGVDVKESIDKAYSKFSDRVPSKASPLVLDFIGKTKVEYEELLSN